MKKFFHYAYGTIVRPVVTCRELAQEKNLWQGWAAVLLIGILYSVVCAIAATRGIEPATKPLLPISKESYYFWETFFVLPVYIGGWYLFAWVNLLLGRKLGGAVSLKSILIPLGFALSIPLIPIMWTTDLVCISFVIDLRTKGVLGQAWGVFYQIFTVLWVVVVCIITTREAHRIPLWKAIVTTLISVLPFAFISAVSIR